MNSVAGYLLGALVSATLAGVGLAIATFERHLADAEQHLATREYPAAAAALEAAAGYADYARWLPWVGNDPAHDIRARDAALRYWQGDYESLAAERSDVSTSDLDGNAQLELILANAAYRNAQGRMTNRGAAVQALDEVMNHYLDVLRNATWLDDAAHNYEYVARLRDEIARGRRTPDQDAEPASDALGQAGAPSEPSKQQFEIYIPLENEERPEEGEAGKAAPPRRRG